MTFFCSIIIIIIVIVISERVKLSDGNITIIRIQYNTYICDRAWEKGPIQ